jgi:PKD repeat protein
MRNREIRREEKSRGRIFFFDPLLLVFLVAGWLLIFGSATLALQRNAEQWLPVEFVPQVSADYGVDAAGAPRLAPVRYDIIDAVKGDALAEQRPRLPVAVAEVTPESLSRLVFPTPTPTVTPTPTLTPTLTLSGGLLVSAGGPYRGDEGSPITLAAGAASVNPGAISYRWDLDGDGEYDDGEGVWATVLFYDEGEYPVGVEATDAQGRVGSASTTVSVANVPPAIYGLRDQSGREGEEVTFSAVVYDPGTDVLLYAWDFGDGSGERGTLEPEHTYVDDGDYVVRLRAEDNDGGVTEALFVMRVMNQPPVVEAGPDQVVDEGATVSLRGQASDPGERDRLSYAWDLDYDGVNFTGDVVGATTSTVYPDGPAEKVAALKVADEDGGERIDTVRVTVNNVAPTIVGMSNDGPVGEGSPLTVVVEAADEGQDELSYGFDWDNDGFFDEEEPTGSLAHVWPNQGDYTVGIRVWDDDGGQVVSTTSVSAYNVAPTAVVGALGWQVEGFPVTLDGSGSSDPGTYDVLSYAWDFGDGSPVVSGTLVAHVYADNGVYSATLRVADDSGAESVAGVLVSVGNANPVVAVGPDQEPYEEEWFRLTATASDPGMGDELSYAWDFDYDGVTFDEEATGSTEVEWRYEDGPAEYVVAFRVRDDDYPYAEGEIGEGLATLQVRVINLAPQVNAGGPYAGEVREPIELSGVGLDVAADRLVYEWDLNGDGHYDLTGRSVITDWNRAGEYEVTLRVTDDDGGVGLDTAEVEVIGSAPPVVEAGGPYSGPEGSPIVLTGSVIDPTGDPLTYTWDLDGDEVFETPGRVVTHTWTDDGEYTVTLRVDDGWGGIGTDQSTVTVSNVPPVVDAGGPYTTTVGITLTLVATATDVPSDTLVYTWDLDDDGSFDDGAGQVVTYVWTATGIYSVTLQVDDGDGGVETDQTTVYVNGLVPIAWLGACYFLFRGKKSVLWKRKQAYNHDCPENDQQPTEMLT